MATLCETQQLVVAYAAVAQAVSAYSQPLPASTFVECYMPMPRSLLPEYTGYCHISHNPANSCIGHNTVHFDHGVATTYSNDVS